MSISMARGRGDTCPNPLCRSRDVARAATVELSGAGLSPKVPEAIRRCRTCACFFTITGVIVKHGPPKRGPRDVQ